VKRLTLLILVLASLGRSVAAQTPTGALAHVDPRAEVAAALYAASTTQAAALFSCSPEEFVGVFVGFRLTGLGNLLKIKCSFAIGAEVGLRSSPGL